MIEEILNKIKVFEDKNFIFDAEKHKYTYNGEEFISVTTFLKQFSEEFDSAYWSKRKAIERLAKKRGISSHNIDEQDPEVALTIKEIIGEWDKKRDFSCDLGTDVHKYIEERFTPGSTITKESFTNPEVLNRIDKFELLYEKRLKKLIPVAQELRIFSKKYKLAGTIDALFLFENKLFIVDWKSNSKYSTDKDKNYQKLKGVFSNEWENEHNKYSIQLNLYKMILEEYGIKVDNCAIVYLPPSIDESVIYKIKDYTTELNNYFTSNLI